MIPPSVAIIANIGSAHLGNFKSLEEIAKEKSNIVDGLLHSPETATVVLNADDDFYLFLRAAAIRKG